MSQKILFKLSGSIAAYKSCDLISKLVQKGIEVQVVATPSALKFVGAATLEGLTRRPVLSDTFTEGQMMSHIELDRWADLTILCPASANTINEMASGICSNLVTTLFLAHDFKKPYLVAPAMNEKMYQHPATAASLRRLRDWGVKVLAVDSGYLGCGETGEGRLLNVNSILQEILLALKDNSKSKGKVLITSGGTLVPIDGVRAITNFSTGKTAAKIAEIFFSAGYEVTYLHAQGAAKPEVPCQFVEFKTFSDLQTQMQNELSSSKVDIFIHAAAVSDYSVKQAMVGKLESKGNVSLELVSNIKLLNMVKQWAANPKLLLIGFKLTVGASAEKRRLAVEKILNEANCDFVALNDLTEVGEQSHRGIIFSKNMYQREFASKSQLAETLVQLVESKEERWGGVEI